MNLTRMVSACMVCFGLWGCGQSAGPSINTPAQQPVTAPAPPAKQHIGLIMKTLTNPFFVEMEKGARRAEKELGVTLKVKTAAQETSIEQQIQLVEDMIADRVAAIVEIAFAAGLGEADQRHPAADATAPAAARQGRQTGDEGGEILDPAPDGVQHLGNALGGGPAGATVGADALGGVEGGGVEPGLARQARGGKPVFRRQGVEGTPDVIMPHGGVIPLAGVVPRARIQMMCRAVGKLS